MEVFDRVAALKRLEGDEARLEALVTDYQGTMGERIARIERALESEDAQSMSEEAEALGEDSRLIGAEGMKELADQMQQAAEQGDFDSLRTLQNHMAMEYEWLVRILDQTRCSGNL